MEKRKKKKKINKYVAPLEQPQTQTDVDKNDYFSVRSVTQRMLTDIKMRLALRKTY
jgi:hypothetical protein